MRLWNIDHQPAVIDHDEPAVQPGDSYEFTKKQLDAGLTGSWSKTDPRKGLKQEQAFKKGRDEESQEASTEADADSGQVARDSA